MTRRIALAAALSLGLAAIAPAAGHAQAPTVQVKDAWARATASTATVGGVFAASAEALADGHVDEAERVRLAAELSEMLAAGQAALGALSPKLPLRGGK
jgi:copper(I)-binding protein